MKQDTATPETLAQLQLDAYNRRDVEAFLQPYSDDVEVYTFPNQLQYKGKERMRARYAQMFATVPDLHSKLLHRMVVGNTAIDHEWVTGKPEGIIEALAMYTVAEGLIARVDFVIRVHP